VLRHRGLGVGVQLGQVGQVGEYEALFGDGVVEAVTGGDHAGVGLRGRDARHAAALELSWAAWPEASRVERDLDEAVLLGELFDSGDGVEHAFVTVVDARRRGGAR
jgi:hypothetical protein